MIPTINMFCLQRPSKRPYLQLQTINPLYDSFCMPVIDKITSGISGENLPNQVSEIHSPELFGIYIVVNKQLGKLLANHRTGSIADEYTNNHTEHTEGTSSLDTDNSNLIYSTISPISKKNSSNILNNQALSISNRINDGDRFQCPLRCGSNHYIFILTITGNISGVICDQNISKTKKYENALKIDLEFASTPVYITTITDAMCVCVSQSYLPVCTKKSCRCNSMFLPNTHIDSGDPEIVCHNDKYIWSLFVPTIMVLLKPHLELYFRKNFSEFAPNNNDSKRKSTIGLNYDKAFVDTTIQNMINNLIIDRANTTLDITASIHNTADFNVPIDHLGYVLSENDFIKTITEKVAADTDKNSADNLIQMKIQGNEDVMKFEEDSSNSFPKNEYQLSELFFDTVGSCSIKKIVNVFDPLIVDTKTIGFPRNILSPMNYNFIDGLVLESQRVSTLSSFSNSVQFNNTLSSIYCDEINNSITNKNDVGEKIINNNQLTNLQLYVNNSNFPNTYLPYLKYISPKIESTVAIMKLSGMYGSLLGNKPRISIKKSVKQDFSCDPTGDKISNMDSSLVYKKTIDACLNEQQLLLTDWETNNCMISVFIKIFVLKFALYNIQCSIQDPANNQNIGKKIKKKEQSKKEMQFALNNLQFIQKMTTTLEILMNKYNITTSAFELFTKNNTSFSFIEKALSFIMIFRFLKSLLLIKSNETDASRSITELKTAPIIPKVSNNLQNNIINAISNIFVSLGNDDKQTMTLTKSNTVKIRLNLSSSIESNISIQKDLANGIYYVAVTPQFKIIKRYAFQNRYASIFPYLISFESVVNPNFADSKLIFQFKLNELIFKNNTENTIQLKNGKYEVNKNINEPDYIFNCQISCTKCEMEELKPKNFISLYRETMLLNNNEFSIVVNSILNNLVIEETLKSSNEVEKNNLYSKIIIDHTLFGPTNTIQYMTIPSDMSRNKKIYISYNVYNNDWNKIIKDTIIRKKSCTEIDKYVCGFSKDIEDETADNYVDSDLYMTLSRFNKFESNKNHQFLSLCELNQNCVNNTNNSIGYINSSNNIIVQKTTTSNHSSLQNMVIEQTNSTSLINPNLDPFVKSLSMKANSNPINSGSTCTLNNLSATKSILQTNDNTYEEESSTKSLLKRKIENVKRKLNIGCNKKIAPVLDDLNVYTNEKSKNKQKKTRIANIGPTNFFALPHLGLKNEMKMIMFDISYILSYSSQVFHHQGNIVITTDNNIIEKDGLPTTNRVIKIDSGEFELESEYLYLNKILTSRPFTNFYKFTKNTGDYAINFDLKIIHVKQQDIKIYDKCCVFFELKSTINIENLLIEKCEVLCNNLQIEIQQTKTRRRCSSSIRSKNNLASCIMIGKTKVPLDKLKIKQYEYLYVGKIYVYYIEAGDKLPFLENIELQFYLNSGNHNKILLHTQKISDIPGVPYVNIRNPYKDNIN